ncbi:MAG: STAS domain-containing protein, partial [Bryobacteraceae bacterium]
GTLMAGLSAIDCFGMGDLISALTTIRGAGGDIKLLNVGAPIKKMFQVTRLDTVLEIYEDESRAVKSFGSHQPAVAEQAPSECFVG